MAQLIKITDCVSRYEWNAYRYPSQYIRLKQENWKKLSKLWDDQSLHSVEPTPIEQTSLLTRLKTSFSKKQEKINSTINALPETEIELRQYFLDKLFPLQMKWATSTVTEVSFLDKEYYDDKSLKYFLQRFPDIYLVMYHPVFTIKKALVDGPIVLISPVGIEIIYLLEKNPNQVIMASDDRTWVVDSGPNNAKIINPTITLKRTEQIIKSILHATELEFPIKKTVLSRKNNIVFSSEPYNTNIIGKFQYEQWFNDKRRLTSPLKSEQLKVVEALLKHCITNSVRRPEWEDEVDPFSTSDEV